MTFEVAMHLSTWWPKAPSTEWSPRPRRQTATGINTMSEKCSAFALGIWKRVGKLRRLVEFVYSCLFLLSFLFGAPALLFFAVVVVGFFFLCFARITVCMCCIPPVLFCLLFFLCQGFSDDEEKVLTYITWICWWLAKSILPLSCDPGS